MIVVFIRRKNVRIITFTCKVSLLHYLLGVVGKRNVFAGSLIFLFVECCVLRCDCSGRGLGYLVQFKGVV